MNRDSFGPPSPPKRDLPQLPSSVFGRRRRHLPYSLLWSKGEEPSSEVTSLPPKTASESFLFDEVPTLPSRRGSLQEGNLFPSSLPLHSTIFPLPYFSPDQEETPMRDPFFHKLYFQRSLLRKQPYVNNHGKNGGPSIFTFFSLHMRIKKPPLPDLFLFLSEQILSPPSFISDYRK